jgi:hypothetical protein
MYCTLPLCDLVCDTSCMLCYPSISLATKEIISRDCSESGEGSYSLLALTSGRCVWNVDVERKVCEILEVLSTTSTSQVKLGHYNSSLGSLQRAVIQVRVSRTSSDLSMCGGRILESSCERFFRRCLQVTGKVYRVHTSGSSIYVLR